MAGKYAPIAKHLSSIPAETVDVTFSFQQIKEILGFPLPLSAYQYQAWWSSDANAKQSQKRSWQGAGWRVTTVDLSREQVRFERFANPSLPLAGKETGQARPSSETHPTAGFSSLPLLEIGNIALNLKNPAWKTVFIFPQGSQVPKGRRGPYFDIVEAAGAIKNRCGCYSWGSQGEIHYCGSFAPDSLRDRFQSSLHSRIHNYLQNHRIKSSGQKNTNLMVFEKINAVLPDEDILLRVFVFDEINLGKRTYSFAEFSEDPDLVHMVEQVLIAWYRKADQCRWNRT